MRELLLLSSRILWKQYFYMFACLLVSLIRLAKYYKLKLQNVPTKFDDQYQESEEEMSCRKHWIRRQLIRYWYEFVHWRVANSETAIIHSGLEWSEQESSQNEVTWPFQSPCTIIYLYMLVKASKLNVIFKAWLTYLCCLLLLSLLFIEVGTRKLIWPNPFCHLLGRFVLLL